MRSILKYYGGKARMLQHLLPLVPEHTQYIESHAGGASLFFAKRPSIIETLNDTNGNVANFYRMLISKFDQVYDLVRGTMHDEHTFKACRKIYRGEIVADDVTRAWAFWVSSVMAYCGDTAGTFQYSRNKTDKWNPAASIRNRREEFEHYRERLALVTVMERDAAEIILAMDAPDVFIYSDPPYVGAKQGPYSGYRLEDFDRLLSAHEQQTGKFILSSYPNDLLTEYVERNGWTQYEYDKRIDATAGTSRKTEVITFNFQLETAPKPAQLEFFA